MNYKETLNLPKTDFPMRAGLAKLEPRMQEKWDSDKLYEKIRKARAGAPNYTLTTARPTRPANSTSASPSTRSSRTSSSSTTR